MTTARRALWTAAGVVVLLCGLACVAGAVLVHGYLVGPLEPYDGTCIGGRAGWAWLQMGLAVTAAVAGGASVVIASGGRAQRAALTVALLAAVVWYVVVVRAIPDVSGLC